MSISRENPRGLSYVDPVDPVFQLDVTPEDLVRVSEATAGDGFSALERLDQQQYRCMSFTPGVGVPEMAVMAQRACALLLAKGGMTVFRILVGNGGSEEEAQRQLAELGVKAFVLDHEVSFPADRMPEEWYQRLIKLGVLDER